MRGGAVPPGRPSRLSRALPSDRPYGGSFPALDGTHLDRPDHAKLAGREPATHPPRTLLPDGPLEVTDVDAVPAAVAKALRQAGPIDVLVNNAAYGHEGVRYEGVLEQSTMDDLQRQFAANVFGPLARIKAVRPGMRARRRGHIINVTSMGRVITMPGIRFYCGSTFAL